MVDLDLDGWLDLFNLYGHVEPEINRVQSSQQYAQLPQLFWNCRGECRRQYKLVGSASSPLSQPLVGRGLAAADYDNDGDIDLVATAIESQAILLRNDQQINNRWIKLNLEHHSSNRFGYGAKGSLQIDGVTQTRYLAPTRSYLSQVELPLVFGVGKAESVDSVTVDWADGSSSTYQNLTTNMTHQLQSQ